MEDKQPTFGNGKICYLEIPAGEIGASAHFYNKTFGWKIRKGMGLFYYPTAIH